MTESKRWMVIINPASGNGSGVKKWQEIQKLLTLYKFNFEFAFTKYANHSVELVHQAIDKGILNLISVGGDGTPRYSISKGYTWLEVYLNGVDVPSR